MPPRRAPAAEARSPETKLEAAVEAAKNGKRQGAAGPGPKTPAGAANGKKRPRSAAAEGGPAAPGGIGKTKVESANGDVSAKKRERADSASGTQEVTKTNGEAKNERLNDDEEMDCWAFENEVLSDLEEEAFGFDDAAFDFGHSKNEGVAADDDDESWRRQLEDFRRKRRAEEDKPALRDAAARLEEPADLVGIVRRAIEGGDWSLVTSPTAVPRTGLMMVAAHELGDAEVVALLTRCAERYEECPRERNVCMLWMLQVLAFRSKSFIGRRELRTALRPLLMRLASRFGAQRLGARAAVWSVSGKWKLAKAVASARLQAAAADQIPKATKLKAAAAMEMKDEEENDEAGVGEEGVAEADEDAEDDE